MLLQRQRFEFDDFLLDANEQILLCGGKPLSITPKAYELLLVLVENHGHLVEKDKLMNAVWADSFVEEANLTFTIGLLRKVLNDNAQKPRFIETVPKRGYRFIADVRHLETKDENSDIGVDESISKLSDKYTSTALPPHPINQNATQVSGVVGDVAVSPINELSPADNNHASVTDGERLTPPAPAEASRWHALFRRLPLVLGGLAMLSVLLLWWDAGGLRTRLLGSDSPVYIKSLAVLPLENLSGDTSQDYFADGVTEELITDLAKVNDLRVTSRPAVMQYKDTRKPASVVAKELNVDAVLTGSVLRSGERLRITVQLIRAGTDGILWSDSYERDIRDVLALQGEMTQNIVREIRSKVTPQETAQFGNTRPVNLEAYEDFLRGRFYANRQNKDDNETAIKALEHAVVADPNFAPAYAELSQAYVWKLFLFAPAEKQLAEKAFVAVEKALSLDPNLAVAHLARGRLLWTPANHFPHEKAIREYRRALALNPHLDEARNQLALVYCHIGAFDEAIEESHKAIATNPNNNLAQFRIGETLNWQGKHEQALSVLRAIPKAANPVLVENHIILALFGLGRKEEADAALEQFLKDYPDDNRGLLTSLQAMLAATAGQEGIAEEKIKVAAERGKGFGHFHHTAYQIACAYALMNKPEQAIKWLETAAEDGFPCYPLFEKDANLNPIRQNPKFQAFLSAQKRQWEYYKSLPQL